jgi:hypothetical protein
VLAFRRLAGLVAFALVPRALIAQANTTKEPKPRIDTSTRQRIANMKAWVDSAAAVPPKQPNAADSLAKRSPAFVDTVVRRGETVVYRELIRSPRRQYEPAMNGQRAPETASSLPAIVLFGFSALVVGVVMVRRDDQSRSAP